MRNNNIMTYRPKFQSSTMRLRPLSTIIPHILSDWAYHREQIELTRSK